jgi:hypothetical protein
VVKGRQVRGDEFRPEGRNRSQGNRGGPGRGGPGVAGSLRIQSRAMVPKAGYFTPLLHVMDVRRSIRFYELLGFELIDLEGTPECPGWARMHCEGGAVMFLLAEEPFDPTKHAVLTAMYTPDLSLHASCCLDFGLIGIKVLLGAVSEESVDGSDDGFAILVRTRSILR